MSTVFDEKLLDKVGMAMVPSGYTNNAPDEGNLNGFIGKVYSVLPEQTTSDSLTTDEDVYQGSESNGVITSTATNGDCRKRFSVTNNYSSYIVSGKLKSISSGSQIGIGYNYNTSFSFSYEEIQRVSVGETFSIKVPSGSQTYANIVFKTVDGLNSGGTFELENILVKGITDGDFDFSRGSDATRVNKDGYIESVQVLSDELVQNGDFEEIGSELAPVEDYDTNFSANPSSGTVTEENGVLTAVNANSVGTAVQMTNRDITVGKIYKVSFSISNYVSGNFKLSVGNQYSPASTGDGDFEYYVKYTSGIDRFYYSFALFTGTVSNVSVKEVGQNWIFPTGWSLEDGKAVANGTDAFLEQASTIQPNTPYRVKFTLSDRVTGILRIALGGYSTGDPAFADGTYTIDVISNASSNSRIYFYAQGTCDFKVDNISVKEITNDTDIPRLDYTNSACPSLLLEPQRSNILTYSEDFSQWTTSGSTSITDNISDVTSPDGNNKASLLDKNGQPYGRIEVINNVTSTGYYTFSVFAKKTDIDSWIKLRIDSVGAKETSFNLSNGEIGTSGVLPYDSGVEVFPNGWYRFYIVVNITDISANEYFRIYVFDNEGGEGNTNEATAYIYGAQVEQGSYPTSYIPTNGTTITRLADVCNNAGDSTIFNDDEGVLFAEISALAKNDVVSRRITLSDGTNNQRVTIELPDNAYPDNSLRVFVYNGVTTFLHNEPVNNIEEFVKIAVKYKQDDFALWVNGVELNSDTLGVTPTGLNQISFTQGNGSNLPFYGNTRQILYFNEALSDAELEYITSADIDLTIHNYKGSLSKISATYEDVGVKDRLTKLF